MPMNPVRPDSTAPSANHPAVDPLSNQPMCSNWMTQTIAIVVYWRF
jgi:hypothetical protein